MTIDELQARPDFVTELTTQQKQWTVEYCKNGADKVAATKTAYPTLAEQSIRPTADRLLRHPTIRRIVNDFYERTDETGSKRELSAMLWKRLQKCTDGDNETFLKLAALYGKWMGFEADAPAPPETPEEDAAELAALATLIHGTAEAGNLAD